MVVVIVLYFVKGFADRISKEGKNAGKNCRRRPQPAADPDRWVPECFVMVR